MDRLDVKKDTYFDSVFLMSTSASLGEVLGLTVGQVVLGTPANRQLLVGQGFNPDILAGVGPTDLIIALRSESEQILEQAQALAHDLLKKRSHATEGTSAHQPLGLDGALRAQPGSNVALISVPGVYAAYEAMRALKAGLHVMLFSDNVSVDDEILLKTEAQKQGRLLMGPDCGTAILDGAMLGFANAVRRGCIGVVGASGTGTQEVTCLIDRAGAGVSQAIGTGGRDLSEAVGARTTLAALSMLGKDLETKVIVVVSKPPAPSITSKVLETLSNIGKPAVVHFVGEPAREPKGKIHFAASLAESATMAVSLSDGRLPKKMSGNVDFDLVAQERNGKKAEQDRLVGLFAGGTLGAEAVAHLREALPDLYTNLGKTKTAKELAKHTILDLGADEYTDGRPHPMIDPTPRIQMIRDAANDTRLSVLLLDVVLGTGSHADPGGCLIDSIQYLKSQARERGHHVSVVTSVTGTDRDTQGLAQQVARLRDAGVIVLGSNIEAVAFARAILGEVSHG